MRLSTLPLVPPGLDDRGGGQHFLRAVAASANIRLSAPACNEQTSNWRHAHEAPPPKLPPLHLVTGWSKADPAKVKHNPKLALFGGWRIEDWEKRKRSRR